MPSKWGARKGGLEGSHTTQVSIPDAPVVGRGGVGANGPRETPGRGRPMPRVWSAPFRHRPEDSLGPWRIVTVAGKWVGVGSGPWVGVGSGIGAKWLLATCQRVIDQGTDVGSGRPKPSKDCLPVRAVVRGEQPMVSGAEGLGFLPGHRHRLAGG